MRTRNIVRAQRVATTLEYYKREQLGESGPLDETVLADLLADMRHYCERHQLDFVGLTQRADHHYTEEAAGRE